MSVKRLFVAIAVPPEIRLALYACKNSVVQTGLSWVKEENLHITLLFMGDTPESEIASIKHSLSGLSNRTPFLLQCKQVEAVRRRGKLSMIWAGFEESTQFIELATSVSKVLNVPLDHKPLPHMTLARVKRGYQVKVDTSLFPDISLYSWEVNSFGLWESVLNPQGSIYTVLQEWHFNA